MEERSEILEAIISRLVTILGVEAETLSEDTEFDSLNMKSVNYSQLTTYLEDECDVEVPFMEFKRNKTIGDAADYVVELIEG